ncbi:MAG TPA: tetratricopeptide repeat protein [Terriglobia bacterium]|nr:tetratricopeptide repeat protein [Terriglobia bacterium]
MATKGVLSVLFRRPGSRVLLGTALALVMVPLVFRGQDMQEPDPQALSQEASEALRQGNAALAVREYRQLLQAHPEMVDARANLAAALVSLGQIDDAIGQYQQALKESPDNSSLRFNLGVTYFRKGDFRQAARQFALLHHEKPGDVRVATLLANCDLHLGQAGQAIELLGPVEKSHPDNLDLERALGMAMARSGRPHEALERVQKVADRGRNAQAYELAAVLYMGLTNFGMARREAEAAIQINPHVSNAYITLAMLDNYSGDQKSAAENYEKALQADPRNLQARIQLGAILYHERKLNDAGRQLHEALVLDPKSFLALYELARVERAQGNLDSAVKDLESCVRENPRWMPPHIELTALYYLLKRPEDGAKEKKIVQQLMAEKERAASAPGVTGPMPPSP